MTRRTIIMIAGPNGAGKTTFAREFWRTGKLSIWRIGRRRTVEIAYGYNSLRTI